MTKIYNLGNKITMKADNLLIQLYKQKKPFRMQRRKCLPLGQIYNKAFWISNKIPRNSRDSKWNERWQSVLRTR